MPSRAKPWGCAMPKAGAGGAGRGIAVVRGEPLFEAPAALYIPPAALRVFLDDFEGPLDLLLFLVRKHKFDIMDIPMTALCRQYATYVEQIVRQDMELAADYLAMSSLLLEIKSKMLLPRPPAEEEEEADPRADLALRLLEYERIQKAAADIAALPRRGRDFICARVAADLPPAVVKPQLQTSLLAAAFAAVLARQKARAPYMARQDSISVREVMSALLRRLRGLKAGAWLAFAAIARPGQAGVAFLALLQMAAESLARLSQKEDGAELYAQLRREEA